MAYSPRSGPHKTCFIWLSNCKSWCNAVSSSKQRAKRSFCELYSNFWISPFNFFALHVLSYVFFSLVAFFSFYVDKMANWIPNRDVLKWYVTFIWFSRKNGGSKVLKNGISDMTRSSKIDHYPILLKCL